MEKGLILFEGEYQMSSAVVIFSGGLDSTTALYWAKKNFDEV